MASRPRPGDYVPGKRPGALQLRAALALIRPFELAAGVTLVGAERIPEQRPLLFVGNHQFFALDTPLLIAALMRARGVLVHGLADDLVFRIPLLRSVASHFGIVRASRDNADALLDDGECVLVYPGGAREAGKGAEHAYELEWWDRLGFAQTALAHRCTIVPVASLGLDTAVRTLADRDDYLASRLRPLIDRLGIRHDLLPPIAVPTRRPQISFRIAEPIAVDPLSLHDEQGAAHRLRSEVAAAIERELALALEPSDA